MPRTKPSSLRATAPLVRIIVRDVLLVILFVPQVPKRLHFNSEHYLSSWTAVLDVTCCAADIAQLVATAADGTILHDSNFIFPLILVVRSLRVIKFLRYCSPVLLETMTRVGSTLNSTLIVNASYIYFFAVIGLELFAGRLAPATDRHISHVLNFDDFSNAVVSSSRPFPLTSRRAKWRANGVCAQVCLIESAFLSGRAWVDDNDVGATGWVFYFVYRCTHTLAVTPARWPPPNVCQPPPEMLSCVLSFCTPNRVMLGVFLIPAFTGFIASVWQLELGIVKEEAKAARSRKKMGPAKKPGGSGRAARQRFLLHMRRTASTESLRMLEHNAAPTVPASAPGVPRE